MSDNPVLQAALELAAQGFHVFPCVADGKEPACENGVHDATTDPEQIRRWFEADPSLNLAAAPDRSGCFVLDLDPPLGAETIASLEMEHGLLPTTLTFQTPRGGLHHWFKGRCNTTVQKIGPKVDTRGYGGYVLVPPSVVNGKPYIQLSSEKAHIADVPEWITHLARASRDKHAARVSELDLPVNIDRARVLLDSYVRQGKTPVKGNGADALTYAMGCALRDLGLSPAMAFEVAMERWGPASIPFAPGYTDEFIKRKFENAAEYMQNDAGAHAVLPAQEVFAAAAAEIGDSIPSGKTGPSRFRLVDLAEAAETFREPRWLIPGLLPAEGTIQVTGPQKSFKTFLVLDMMLGIAAGVETFGHTPDAAPIVYVVGENAHALALKHVAAWRMARGQEANFQFYVVPEMPRASEQPQFEELIREIQARQVKPAVVVLDTATRALRGLDENSAKDMGTFSAACEYIQRSLQCSVLVIRHTGKDSARGGRGSNVLEGDFDTVLAVERHEKSMLVKLTVEEQRNAPEREEPYTFEGTLSGPSLAFHMIPPSDFTRATKPPNPVENAKVGAALHRLGANSTAKAATTQMLVSELRRGQGYDALAEKALAKVLNRAAGEALAAYAHGSAAARVWFIPPADQD